MKIYTKTGDKGMTTLVGGASVSKNSDRVESYGSTDELNSWVGYVISLLPEKYEKVANNLRELQSLIFDLGMDLSTPLERGAKGKLDESMVKWLEDQIDEFTKETPQLKCFVLPGGVPVVSAIHIARTTTRRAERAIVRLNTLSYIPPQDIKFINRLSDYFYALARYINHKEGYEDIPYNPHR